MWSAQWDGDYVVGGDGNLRLTPSFRLKEFSGAGGKVRVHRELVSTLQLLRERLHRPLSVKRTDASGDAVVIACDVTADLQTAAAALRDRGLFASVDDQPDGIRVALPDAAKRGALTLEQGLETAFSVTAGFETAGDKFQQITGNFDGAGLSFGPAQVNFKSETLVPLFRKFEAADEPALRRCFADPDDYSDWQRITKAAVADQIAWATSITTGRGNHDVVDPWKGYFQAVGREPRFREIMVESILRDYGGRAARAITALRRIRPDITIDHLRCICSLYDLVVQQGSLDKALDEIEQRVNRERPSNQFDLVRIAVEERGKKASEEWRADAVSRRVGILMGVPFTVQDRQRANIQFYMLRDLRVSNVDRLISGDIAGELARVGKVVAADDTLLA